MGQTTSFIRRHARACITSGVAVAALAGGGVAYAATSSGPAPAQASHPPASASTPATGGPASGGGTAGRGAGHAGGATKAKHPGVRGTVTAVNGGTWTVKTAKGVSMNVTVTPQTAFGTKQAPSSAASFPVGATIRVVGQRSGTTITATRIVAPKPAGASTTSTTVAS